MQKTKFKTEIHKNGVHSEMLLTILGNVNAGLAPLTLNDIMSFIKCRNAQYPTLTNIVVWDEKTDTIHISDKDQKEPYLSIQECTYDELGEIGAPADDNLSVLNAIVIDEENEKTLHY